MVKLEPTRDLDEEQHVELCSTEAAVSALLRDPRSAAGLKLEIYLSQGYYIPLNPLTAFMLALLFDVLIYLISKAEAFLCSTFHP